MTTIGNIGIGLFLLIILWILALILFVVSVRLQSNWGWIGLGVVLAITLIFSLIPLETKHKLTSIPEEKDYQLIYKYILLSFLLFSFLSLLLIFFFTYLIEPIRPKLLKC